MCRFALVILPRISERGFTLVELTVLITVAAIILAIAVDSAAGYQLQGRDTERHSDIEVIAQSLERHYRAQAVVAGSSYPATSIGTAGLVTLVGDTDASTAPGQASNSLLMADSSSDQLPSPTSYVYQPLNLNGLLCTVVPCVRYKIYYRLEKANEIVVRNSMRQQ